MGVLERRILKNNKVAIVMEPSFISFYNGEILNNFSVFIFEQSSKELIGEINIPKPLPNANINANTLITPSISDVNALIAQSQKQNAQKNQQTATEIADYVDKLFS